MWKLIVSLVLFMVSPGDGLFRSIYRSTIFSPPFKGNAGWPLFLSPYIQAGKIKEAQKKSEVSPYPGMNLKSYAGYITVNRTYNSNLFFWFFPARIQPENAPVVLWLQGGPGGSSMFGLFVEHGPYVITSNLTVLARDFTWTTTLSMLYIDNPVGTGFSFTDDSRGYANSENDVAQNLYSALVQFFKLFPEYAKNSFYVTGESYAGKYVPAIAHYIHSFNPVREFKIRLEGIAIGDAYSDPESIIGGYATFLYQIGLLDEQQQKHFQKQCNKCIKYIKDQHWLKAFEILDKLLDSDLTNDPSYFQNVTGCTNYYNILQCTEPEDQGYYGKFLSLPQVRQAIHVGNRTFSDGAETEKYLREDTVKSVKTWLAEIMDHYKAMLIPCEVHLPVLVTIQVKNGMNYLYEVCLQVLLYNGQLDIIVAAALTERSLLAMDWTGLQKYKKAKKVVWKIFKSDNDVAGYVRSVDKFHQVIVRGGGHILPYDQPLRSFDMINRFIFDRGWEPYNS